jgi:hypothetical protein
MLFFLCTYSVYLSAQKNNQLLWVTFGVGAANEPPSIEDGASALGTHISANYAINQHLITVNTSKFTDSILRFSKEYTECKGFSAMYGQILAKNDKNTAWLALSGGVSYLFGKDKMKSTPIVGDNGVLIPTYTYYDFLDVGMVGQLQSVWMPWKHIGIGATVFGTRTKEGRYPSGLVFSVLIR